MPTQGKQSGQMLLAEEYFAGENPALLETLRSANALKSRSNENQVARLLGFVDSLISPTNQYER